MQITVMSRANAVSYCHRSHEKKSVIISISDPYFLYSAAPFTSRTNGVVGVLRLCFADADRAEGTDVYGRTAYANDLMSDEDAKNIISFLKRYPNCDVIVHCDAGISRSSGVAAALMRYYNGDDSEIFDSGRYRPNMWCYRKMLNALMDEEQ